MPGGAVELVGCTLFGLLNKYVKHRLLLAIISMVITLMGTCMLAFANQNKQARLTGYYLFYIAPVAMICALSCFSSNVAGHTKKITVNAIYLILYCVGNIIGPQTFRAKEAPDYRSAKITIVACYVVSLLLLIILYYSYWAENRKRDCISQQKREDGNDPEFFMVNQEFADLTDKQNPHFRYAL
ncbi:unnamed protein product [Ambrosiozyma monospora]|uniref:Unnamed protein product n=1 Tax=Ambrosiozyma monospora TaxID=43982 RepID=A0ACB5T206_AMBMO|nr:unnamed protein product [Ambrosiozyma monospora]